MQDFPKNVRGEAMSPSGQTGHDLYVYEAAQISNAKRLLDDRMGRLLRTIRREQPELFQDSSDYETVNADAGMADGLLDLLRG